MTAKEVGDWIRESLGLMAVSPPKGEIPMSPRTYEEFPPRERVRVEVSAKETELVKRGREYSFETQDRVVWDPTPPKGWGAGYRTAECTLKGYLSCTRHAVYWSPSPDNALGEDCPFCRMERYCPRCQTHSMGHLKPGYCSQCAYKDGEYPEEEAKRP